jgi:hypothetical protein
VGTASVIAPAYIAECSPAHLRGRLGSLQQLAIVVGIFVALLCDYFIAVSAGSAEAPFLFGVAAWRWMFWTAAPPAILYGMAALMIPERQPKFSDLLGRSGGLLHIVWLGIGLSGFQQFVGINVIFYYSSVLWRAVGFSEQSSLSKSVYGAL